MMQSKSEKENILNSQIALEKQNNELVADEKEFKT